MLKSTVMSDPQVLPTEQESQTAHHNSDINMPEADIKCSESYIYQTCKIDYYEQNRNRVKQGMQANE